ncbi:MAG: carbohydrate porin [Enhydrobacter sp.]|nr:MAG: carbohydrate porin [Enhydrobacter sp.]
MFYRLALAAPWSMPILAWVEDAAAQIPAFSVPTEERRVASVSGNPGATTYMPGTGWLGHTLGLKDEWGVTLGGLWLGDLNLTAAGGMRPGHVTGNSALFVGLLADVDKAIGWTGASFGVQFLQINVSDTNADAGSVSGYNAITGPLPHNRTQLYQAWYAQQIVKDMLQVRVGRVLPGLDFNNVLRPVIFDDDNENIPAVTGAINTMVFVNGSMLGVLPGYYNPAVGATLYFTPTRSFYFNVGVYDGNLARGNQIGLIAPQFNGYHFGIGEMGFNWVVGEHRHPGQFGIGLWRQTGRLQAGAATEEGTGGVYLFGSQRLAHGINARVPSSGITAFAQYGVNQSRTMPINQFYGGGVTAFALIGNRAKDSMGLTVGLARLNPNLFARSSELMFQAYYQAHLFAAVFLQPTVSYIPTPGASVSASGALTTTMRLTVLF